MLTPEEERRRHGRGYCPFCRKVVKYRVLYLPRVFVRTHYKLYQVRCHECRACGPEKSTCDEARDAWSHAVRDDLKTKTK